MNLIDLIEICLDQILIRRNNNMDITMSGITNNSNNGNNNINQSEEDIVKYILNIRYTK